MREKIINALNYPRWLVRGMIELDECIHSGYYARDDTECRECDYAMLCEWLNVNDECAVLEQWPFERLTDSLKFSVSMVDALISRPGHNRHTCRCQTCAWLKDAQKLLLEAQND